MLQMFFFVFCFFADGKRINYFRWEFQGWNKGVAYSNILWMMSGSISHDDVLDSCMIWRSETNLGKVRCLYIGSHESKLKRNPVRV